MGKTEILFSKINKNWKKFKTKLNNIFLMMNNHFLLLTLIVEFGIFASEVEITRLNLKNEASLILPSRIAKNS